MKLLWLIKVCLKEAYSRIWVGKYLSDKFSVKNCLKKGDVLPPLLINLALYYATGPVQVKKDCLKLNCTDRPSLMQMILIYIGLKYYKEKHKILSGC
jgi:hypothetical protein